MIKQIKSAPGHQKARDLQGLQLFFKDHDARQRQKHRAELYENLGIGRRGVIDALGEPDVVEREAERSNDQQPWRPAQDNEFFAVPDRKPRKQKSEGHGKPEPHQRDRIDPFERHLDKNGQQPPEQCRDGSVQNAVNSFVGIELR